MSGISSAYKRARAMKRPRSGGPMSRAKRFRAGTGARRTFTTVPRSRGWAGVRSETKIIDLSVADKTITASDDWTGSEMDDTAALSIVTQPASGAAINQRIGKKITVKRIRVRGFVQCAKQADAVASDAGALIRIIVFQDKQTNAAQVQGETLMVGTGASTNIASFQSLDSLGRFRVLKDFTMTLQNPSMSYDGTNLEQAGLVRPFKFSLNFAKGVVVNYNATASATITSVVDNSFHMLAICQSADLVPKMSYYSRMYYKDQ